MTATLEEAKLIAKRQGQEGQLAVFKGSNLLRLFIASWPKMIQQFVGYVHTNYLFMPSHLDRLSIVSLSSTLTLPTSVSLIIVSLSFPSPSMATTLQYETANSLKQSNLRVTATPSSLPSSSPVSSSFLCSSPSPSVTISAVDRLLSTHMESLSSLFFRLVLSAVSTTPANLWVLSSYVQSFSPSLC